MHDYEYYEYFPFQEPFCQLCMCCLLQTCCWCNAVTRTCLLRDARFCVRSTLGTAIARDECSYYCNKDGERGEVSVNSFFLELGKLV
jgi:hypothetical protein